jgi:hypothetical protein
MVQKKIPAGMKLRIGKVKEIGILCFGTFTA